MPMRWARAPANRYLCAHHVGSQVIWDHHFLEYLVLRTDKDIVSSRYLVERPVGSWVIWDHHLLECLVLRSVKNIMSLICYL